MYIDTVFTYLSGMVFTYYKAKQVTKITGQIPNNLCLKSLVWFLVSWAWIFEQWKNPGYLLYIGDYTTQVYMDYNEPWNKDPY